jgi:hypothetical protein
MLAPLSFLPAIGTPPGKNGLGNRRRPTVGSFRRGLGQGAGAYLSVPMAEWAVA